MTSKGSIQSLILEDKGLVKGEGVSYLI